MKLFLKHLIVILLLICNLNAYSDKSEMYDTYLESMFSSKYKDTKSILASLNKNHKNEISTKLAFANFWLVMYETSGEEENYQILCENNAKAAIKLINIKENKSYDDIFHLISAKSILLKIQFDKKNYLKAARGLKDIIKYFEFALDHEENIKMKLISGMYNYYIETAKEDYPIVHPLLLFYPSGDKQKGLRLLKECTKENDKRVSVRSLLYLARIYYKDEKDLTGSVYYFNKLLSLYPGNLIWRFEYIQSLNKFNKIEDAEKQKEIISNNVNNSIHITNEQKAFFLNYN